MAFQWIDRLRARLAAWVSACTAWLAWCVAPLMPWFFVALRRALIPTLVGMSAAVLFFVVPQSREVLHGMGEPVLRSLADFSVDGHRGSINVWAWLSYVAAAVMLGASVWYSARLLVTVGGERATPNELETDPGQARLLRAITWYPRWLGAAVMAAAIGALLFASYTPQLPAAAALALAIAAIGGPWGVAVGAWMRVHGWRPALVRACAMLGVATSLVAAVLLVVMHRKWPVWCWSVACAAMPALFWWLLTERRAQLQRRAAHDLGDASASRTFGSVIVNTVLLALGGGALLLALALLPPLPIRAVGSAATVLVFMAASAAFLSASQLVLRFVAGEVPGLTTAAVAVGALMVALIGQEGLGDEALPPPPVDATALRAAPAASAASGPAPAPAVAAFVNAHGGGLRAAVFTALVLAQADDASCGALGPRLRALSGVSGGSVGIATYLVARQELAPFTPWAACGTSARAATPLTDVVAYALVQDHLSPVVSRMLAVDAPHLHSLMLQPPTRGQALLQSWNGALLAGLEQQVGKDRAGRLSGLALPLSALHGGLEPRPQAIFNAADADTGHIVWFDNRAGGWAETHGQSGPSTLSVGQAVLHSARFPVVTPAGAFAAPWAGAGLPQRLVDGGYVDNSGTTSLEPLVRTAGMSWRIDLDGNPREVTACAQAGARRAPVLTAVQGLLQARTAHADQAVARLQRAAGGGGGHLPLSLDLAKLYRLPDGQPDCARIRQVLQPPLGWYMSWEAASVLLHASREAAVELCRRLQLGCRELPSLPPLPGA